MSQYCTPFYTAPAAFSKLLSMLARDCTAGMKVHEWKTVFTGEKNMKILQHEH